MKARPILFSGSMVRALLAGTKTQTRRIVKPQPEYAPQHCHYSRTAWARSSDAGACTCDPVAAPYGVPGDLLWVKERLARTPDLWTYVADGAEVEWPARRDLASKRLDYAPSIHMPKVASRLTLDITDVRVERLQDISEADAIAEGVVRFDLDGWSSFNTADGGADTEGATAVEGYEYLWRSINGADSWAANPFVWALTFTIHEQNVDALIRAKEAA